MGNVDCCAANEDEFQIDLGPGEVNFNACR